MKGVPSVVRRDASQKSNVELINSLRANFVAAKQQLTEAQEQQQQQTNDANSAGTRDDQKTTLPAWTGHEEKPDTVYIPATDFGNSGLSEERDQYDITVKLFYLPGIPASRRCAHTRQAIDLVLKELHVESVDLLIVSFPGVSFDADDADDEEELDDGTSRPGSKNGSAASSATAEEPDDFDGMVRTWNTLESLQQKGMISQLGVAEFGTERLEKFLQHTHVRPSVDQINVRDCCVVPKTLILYAKREEIQLLTHNDCTDILPPGTTRELLGPGDKGAGILAASPDALNGGVQGDVEPQWVVKYTAVVKDRGVIENKGYFALAEVGSCVQPRT
jgi:glutamate--cysteine ligase regulatory subunit